MPDNLPVLQARMTRLVKWRSDRLAELEREIRQVNADFDRSALALGREINRLLPTPEPVVTATITPIRKRKQRPELVPTVDPDWTDEDKQHFAELLNQRRGGGDVNAVA